MQAYILIIRALIPLALIGVVVGIILGISGNRLRAKSGGIVEKLTTILPGTDCGACGFSSCEAFAESLAVKSVRPNKCSLADTATIVQLARMSGQKALRTQRMRAQIMCSGTSDLAPKKFKYDGIMDCVSVAQLGTGDKACPYGCLGYGTCVKTCPFNAIKVENGVAVVEYEKCIGCGLCADACPKHLIRMVPYDSEYWVGCHARSKGDIVKSYCGVGCIGCGICEENCSVDAIKLVNNLASIDYKKCIQCGTCFEKCPRSSIWYGAFQIKNGDTRSGSFQGRIE